MNFTQIPSELHYPRKHLAALSSMHSSIISAFISDYSSASSRPKRREITNILNCISYIIISGDSVPSEFDVDNPLETFDASGYDESDVRSTIGNLFVNFDDVVWDIQIDESITSESNPKHEPVATMKTPVQSSNSLETPKENLWLKPREIPRFDPTKPWLHIAKAGSEYTIPASIPTIPTRQRDITITTNVDLMSNSDIDKLFPNQFIRTRKPCMYEPVSGVELHDTFGLILSISGFTRDQVLDNIIKYPHMYIVRRDVDGEIRNFYTDIEIESELKSIESVWDELEDTKSLPRTKDFMIEYVVRRYLLERDNNTVSHKYLMIGDLKPYLTLFMPKSQYEQLGYFNIGRDHVRSRVAYLQSLNPMLRSIYMCDTPYCVKECPFSGQCTDLECDLSCPKYTELTYLLERNRINLKSNVFSVSETLIQKAQAILHTDKDLIVLESTKTIDTSNLLAYLSCCERWKGNCLNCSVYHLSYSEHIDSVQRSWSVKDTPDALEYEQIWMGYASILIISNLDYIQFKDFQAQTLLNLLHNRERDGKKTVIVSPKIENLIGKGQFFDLLKSKLREAVIVQ